jgi:hypothetical protein
MFQPGANVYTQGFGSRPENVEVPHYDVRAPTTTDVNYPLGKWWLYVGNSLWYLLSLSSAGGSLSANWIQIASASGDILSVIGTANQITAATTAGIVTLSTPTTFIAPGSIASTTTITAATGLTVTLGGAAITGTTNINTTGAGVTSIGTGGTGPTNIGNATGNTAMTGSLTASTSLTATLGNITATNGNLVLGTAGNKNIYSSVASTTTAGANSAGTVTLTGGSATISTTAITAASIVRLYRQGVGSTGAAALGIVSLGTVSAGVSFIINSWLTANATSLCTTDVSVIAWEIVN